MRRIKTVESSKNYLLKNTKLKENWNQSRIKLVSYHTSKKSIAEEISVEDETAKEFSLEKPIKNMNDSINNFQNGKTTQSTHIARFASTKLKLKKVCSNLNNLFLEDLKGRKKIVGKSLHDLKTKYDQSNVSKKMWNPGDHLKITKEVENTTNEERSPEIALLLTPVGEENNVFGKKPVMKTQILKDKILEKIKENHKKFVSLGSFEIQSKILLTTLKSDPKISISKENVSMIKKKPKFLVLNRQNSLVQTPKNDVPPQKLIPLRTKYDLFPLKYISEKLRDMKHQSLSRQRKAFSFHSFSTCKSPSNFSAYKI